MTKSSLLQSREFFQLSQAEKHALPEYQRPGTEIIRSELSLKEVFKIDKPGRSTSDGWPSDVRLPGFHHFFDRFWQDCANLFDQLLDCLSDAPNLDPQDRFLKFHTTSRYRMNLHHYPAVATSEEYHTRMGPHSDTGTLSLLFQDEIGGLEVGDRNSVAGKCSARTFGQLNGKFKAVQPIDGTILVFVGYMMGQWTNSRWKSTIHHVTMPTPEKTESPLQPERFSMTFFGTPDAGTIIEPLPGTWNNDNPKLRNKFEVDSYLLRKDMEIAPSETS
jgi:isopenicillin N synthase-like dioxygenase